MYSEYPIWSVEDARAGVYKRGSIVIYSPDDVLRYIYIATEDYDGSLLPPSVAIGWAYLDTIVDDWQAGKVYKIGNVVRFNNILYVATRRYRGGSVPPNEETDPDGVRTWMLSYEDGKTPVTPFFYRKTFGYKNESEAYPYGNALEDISIDVTPTSSEAQDNFNWPYDRFRSFRTLNSDGNWADNVWQHAKEQSLSNSVMEAHPYHDIYVLGYTPYSPPPALPKPFVWYDHAVHQSEQRDKLFYWLTRMPETPTYWYSKAFIPKRNIPYYGGNYYWFFDFGTMFPNMTNGTSLEFYPDEPFENFEIIQKEYHSKMMRKNSNKNILIYQRYNPIPEITPIVCSGSTAYAEIGKNGQRLTFIPKVSLIVIPTNICADDISITFHFLKSLIICTEQYDYESEMDTIKCAPAIQSFIHKTFEYNDLTRDGSPDDDTALFKGIVNKWKDNPLYNPNCVDDPSDPNDFCPWPYVGEVDPAYPDTSIDMSGHLGSTPNSIVQIRLVGWTIN